MSADPTISIQEKDGLILIDMKIGNGYMRSFPHKITALHSGRLFVYSVRMENIKVEIEVGSVRNLSEALRLSDEIYQPSPEEAEKYHNKEDWKEKIETGGVLVIGKAEEKMAGFIVAYKTSDDVMHIWNAGVLPEYEDLGIFSNMFEELAVECRRLGIKKVTLHAIEKRHPEIYKYAINKGFNEYEKEWVEDSKYGQVEKSKFEMEL